jgi:hypothetical protein
VEFFGRSGLPARIATVSIESHAVRARVLDDGAIEVWRSNSAAAPEPAYLSVVSDDGQQRTVMISLF